MNWKKVAAITAAVGLVVVLVVFSDRLSADFWPPDSSRVAPNLVAALIQYAVILILAVLLYPPFRRAVERFVTRHTAPIHERLDRLHQQREEHHAAQMKKLDAIHQHLRDHT